MSRSILKSTSQIGFLALMSRCIAFLREFLLIRFLSIGDLSDIYFTAFRIPNTMRKIFAEGMLSSILIPSMVRAEHKGGCDRANRLTTLAFLAIELFIFLFCCFIFLFSQKTIALIAPGFAPEKIYRTAILLKILIFFILFISSGAIFAAALQAHKKFFIPAIAPAILNVLYVAVLLGCWFFDLSLEAFSLLVVFVAVIYFIVHLIAYFYMHFSIATPNKEAWLDFKTVIMQFFPCFIGGGILEINNFINTAFASYLSSGSMTLIRTAYQFVNIPVGIIAASLSTVLLPHFSKLHIQESKNMSDHIFEAIKFTLWSTLPLFFLLSFFSKEIFQTLFWGDMQALEKIDLAQSIFIAYLIGLLSFSLNKILVTILFALKLSFVPMIATLISILINYGLNKWLVVLYQATGIAFSSSVSSISQTIFLLLFLYLYLKLPINTKEYLRFFRNYLLQLLLHCFSFWILYRLFFEVISLWKFDFGFSLFGYFVISVNNYLFIKGIGIWLWAIPLSLWFLWMLYSTRKRFGIELEYFDK
ncbi:murein biosynthesis integral membrane protein MurJ [Candidatus Dependentiae bacterium]|nr:murein biosynthesis integral membrane protein MurJ [Candidatus Dependentiae bacterium]